MNRTYKFRAWDKKNEEMINDIHIAPEYGWIVLADNDAMEERGLAEEGQFELMQYTNLKDRNGREIYEGDIARVKQTVWGYVEHLIKIIWDEEDARFTNIVIKKIGEDRHNTPDEGEGWSMNVIRDWVEVIGNIHENPELLK